MGMTRFLVITGMILAAAAARLIPHPPNFTPVAAMALFAGATLSRPGLALLVPFAAMVLSDVVIYSSHSQHFDPMIYLIGQAVVYGCFGLTVGMGRWLRSRYTVPCIAGTMLASSVLFFVVTNFAVWVMGQGLGRPMTPAGLLACYVDALPFFRNTVLGDALFSAVLFGGFILAEHYFPALREPVLVPAAAEPHNQGSTERDAYLGPSR